MTRPPLLARLGDTVVFCVHGVRIAGVIAAVDPPGQRALVEYFSGLARGETRIWLPLTALELPAPPPASVEVA